MIQGTEAGNAGEYLVCADLSRRGYPSVLGQQGRPYDIITEMGEGQFVTIQVKTTAGPQPYWSKSSSNHYAFHLQRKAQNNRKTNLSPIVTYVACVVLSTGEIAYLSREQFTKEDGTPKRYLTFNVGKHTIDNYKNFPPQS